MGARARDGARGAGTLNVYLTEAGLAGREAAVAEHRAAGMRVELLDAAALRERQPAILGAAGAAFYPDDAHVDSLVFTQRVAAAAERQGARVLEGVEVLGVTRSPAELRLQTTSGTIAAQSIVLAAGVWSPRLAHDLDVTLPLVGAKGYHVELEGLQAAVQQPVYLYETRVVATPVGNRLRLAGTLELGSDPDALSRRRMDAVLDAAPGTSPGWRGPVSRTSGAASARCPRTACPSSAAHRRMIACWWRPATACWASRSRRAPAS